MYNIPQGQITFADVRNFCADGHEESLILDYKSDWPSELNRVLCGMANVQGGMVLVGVGTQPGTRLPAWPPPGVEGTDDQLNQRVVQIAYDAIYPPIFPLVDIVRLDSDPARAIVVIRVDASRLLHATDQRRRVYVRVFDHTRGVLNDLANLSQLDWLFQQRARSIELRESAIGRSEERAKAHISRYLRPTESNVPLPIVAIRAIPTFPQASAARTASEVFQKASAIGSVKAAPPHSSLVIPHRGRWRTTADGAFALPLGPEATPQYAETSIQGLVYLEQVLPTQSATDRDTDQQIRVVRGYSVLACVDAFVSFAAQFYQRLHWHGPIQLHASLKGAQGIVLDHRHPHHWSDPMYEPSSERFTQDAELVLFGGELQAQTFGDAKRAVLTNVAQNLMWAFGFADDREQLADYVAGLLEWPKESAVH